MFQSRHHSDWRTALPIALAAATLPVFLYSALPQYSTGQRLLAWLIFTIGTTPGLRYFAQPKGVPLIELVGLQYALSFGLPVFFESDLRVMGGNTIRPADSAVTYALLCAALAVAYILIGYGLARQLLRLPRPAISRRASPKRLFIYGVATTLGALALFWTGVGYRAGWQGPIEIVLPRTLGLAVLACLYYGADLGKAQRVIVILVFAAATIWGLLGSMTQTALEPLIIWALARWVVRHRAPIALGAGIVGLVLLLQPVKGFYRSFMGSGARTFSAQEAIGAYFSLTRVYWSSVGSAGVILEQGQASAAQRLSLLQATAHYIQLTPQYVTYKGPRTLLYPTYSWMPRFLWPDKPTAQEANKVLPVEYGIQSPENLATTMFGVGHVAEAYTAFGLAGIMPVFLVLGLLYALPQLLLQREGVMNLGATAVLIWFAINLMYIGSTVGTAFGGLLQSIIVQVIVFGLLASGHRIRSGSVTTGLTPDLRTSPSSI